MNHADSSDFCLHLFQMSWSNEFSTIHFPHYSFHIPLSTFHFPYQNPIYDNRGLTLFLNSSCRPVTLPHLVTLDNLLAHYDPLSSWLFMSWLRDPMTPWHFSKTSFLYIIMFISLVCYLFHSLNRIYPLGAKTYFRCRMSHIKEKSRAFYISDKMNSSIVLDTTESPANSILTPLDLFLYSYLTVSGTSEIWEVPESTTNKHQVIERSEYHRKTSRIITWKYFKVLLIKQQHHTKYCNDLPTFAELISYKD